MLGFNKGRVVVVRISKIGGVPGRVSENKIRRKDRETLKIGLICGLFACISNKICALNQLIVGELSQAHLIWNHPFYTAHIKSISGVLVMSCPLLAYSSSSMETLAVIFKLINGSFFHSYFHSFMYRVYIEGNHHSKNGKE